MAGAAILITMFILGKWVSQKVESSVAEFAGASAALYINTFIAPHLQELAYRDSLSQASTEALNKVLEQPAVRTHVTSVKIWRRDGLIIYCDNRSLIGRQFNPSSHLQQALAGRVSTQVGDRHHDDDPEGAASSLFQLAVYTPIHDANTGQVLAVLEFYENAEELQEQLSLAEAQSWAVAGVVAAGMIGALFTILSQGSRAMEQLRGSLFQRVAQLRELLRQNEALRARAERAGRNTIDGNERFMPRMAFDLRDGPAQSISLALLHMKALEQSGLVEGNAALVSNALSKALRDVWNISASLMMPEVKELSFKDALGFVIEGHGRRIQWAVHHDLSDELPTCPPEFIKIFAARFVQVCLDGLSPHAGTTRPHVCVRRDGAAVVLEIKGRCHDAGTENTTAQSIQLGLAGIWDQIESIGGTITVVNGPTGDVYLAARLPFSPEA
ncbi:sensor histidine kinase [Microvirga aerilata]|uniref:sensor histidine kinase n=1 Tax=Microvirga aerilata TaxID=670292 RepID=UPI0036308151